MPHSSGGGSSHSSSSHSSSSHSSHSSYSSSSHTRTAPIRTTPATGYSKYAFYENGNLSYKYLLNKQQSGVGGKLFLILFLILFYSIFFIVGFGMLFSSISITKPLNLNYQNEIVIKDNLGKIDENEMNEITTLLENFKNKTGVSISFQTFENEYWWENYTYLEDFAYDLYVQQFDDERHWLIVFTETEFDDIYGNDGEWYWEGMQGDETDNILYDTVPLFNEKFQEYLYEGDSYDDAFIKAISNISDVSIKEEIKVKDSELLTVAIFWLLFVSVHCAFMTIGTLSGLKPDKNLEKEREKGFLVNEKTIEETCGSCGKKIVKGIHTRCPHCNASLSKNIEKNYTTRPTNEKTYGNGYDDSFKEKSFFDNEIKR